MQLKVKYHQATGEIVAWGEQLPAEEGFGILDGVDGDLVQYLRIIGAKVVNGQLQYDQAKLDAVRAPMPPQG
jgi:hypothetical protein